MWGIEFLLILDLWGISFHAAIVFGLGKNLLFKSVLGHCAELGAELRKENKLIYELYDYFICTKGQSEL